jgi:hypothetical protein
MLISFLFVLVSLGTQTPSQTASVDSLGWLSGCWSREANGRRTEEHWMKPAGGTLLGMSRTVANGRTVEFEHLLIRADGADVLYVAKPSRQAEASFKLVDHSPDWRRLRFENPQHDFPQRIEYELAGDESLTATISGRSGGRERTIAYPMKRGC